MRLASVRSSAGPAVARRERETREPIAPVPLSTITAPTELLRTNGEGYAFRRIGTAAARPLLCLQHFTGTLDHWDPAIIDPLAAGREVLLFDSAGLGRSTGRVPETVAGMARHALAFLDGLKVPHCDVLGFSLGGMVAQVMAQERPALVRRVILVGTAPRGGEDILCLDKPELARHLGDPNLRGNAVLQKLFFTPSQGSQSAGKAFLRRLARRTEDLDRPVGLGVAQSQLIACREWEQVSGERFADLKAIRQPALVVNGVADAMISVKNSYWLAEHLPNAMLLTYPDAGHGSMSQYANSFTRQATAFLASDSPYAAY